MKKFLLFLFILAFTSFVKAQQLTPTTATIVLGSPTPLYITDNWNNFGDDATPNQDVIDWFISSTSPTGGYITFYDFNGLGWDYRGWNPIVVNGAAFPSTGTYYIRNYSDGYSAPMTLTVINSSVTSAGTISSNQSVCSGGVPAQLTLTGFSGTNIRLQWFQKVGSGNFTPIAGATGTTYQPSTTTQNTTYFVNEYNYENTAVASSGYGIITVYSTSITPGTFSNSTICYNASKSLTEATAASGGSGTYSYSWLGSTDGSNYSPITGANSIGYVTPNLTSVQYYKRVVTDTKCGYTATSNPITVSVYGNFLAGTVGNAQTVGLNGTPALLTTLTSPSGSDGSYSTNWQSSTDNVNFSDISGATGSTYQPGALTVATYFRKKVASLCGTIYTPSFLISVMLPGTIGNDQTICNNTAPSQIATTIAPTGGYGTTLNQWESSLNNSTWNTISGATLVSYQPAALTINTYYRKKVTDSNNFSAYSNTVLVTVRSIFSVGTIGDPQSICYNTTPALLGNSTAPSGGAGGYSYVWESSTDNVNFFLISGQSGVTYQPGALTQSTYYRRKVTDASCGNGYSPSILITVKPNFNVGTIASSQTLCYNTTPTLLNTAIAPSGGMGVYSYSWEYSVNGTDWSIISSGTNESYQPGALLATTYYRRKVTDSSCGSGYNPTITITVRPVFNAGAVGVDQNICYNTAPNLLTTTTAPTGGSGSFTYTWENSTDNISWNVINLATGTSYQPGVLSAKMYYRKSVTDICGFGYTTPATITVKADVNFGSIGSSQTICSGGTPSLLSTDIAPTGGTGSFTWLWESSPNNSTWSPIIGATSEAYQPGSLTATTYYRRKVINPCGSNYANTITITVRPAIVSGSIVNSQTLCFNATPSLLVTNVFPTGGTGSFTFQWESSTNNTNWSTIVGATNETYQPSAMSSTMYFHRLETSGTCGTVQTSSVQITVNNQLVAGSIKSDQTICYGTSPSVLLTNTYPTGGTGSFTYQWQKLIGSSWTDIAGANTETYTPEPLTATSYFRRAETSGTCGTVYTNQITITVYSQFLPGVIGSSQTVNYNTAPTELVSFQSATGGTGSFTYQWQNSLDNSIWSNISGANAESYQPGALTAKTYYKRVTTSGTCGTTATNVLTINVNLQLSAGEVKDNQTICFNATPSPLTTSVAPTGGNGVYTYQWEKTENGTTWTSITAANSDSYQPGSLAVTTYFRKKVTSVSLAEYSNIVTVTVYDNFVPGIIGADQTICNGSTPNPLNSVNLPTGGSGSYTNQWKTSLNGSSWSDITGATDSYYEPTALTVRTYFKKIVTNLCGVKETNAVTISVNPIFTPGTIGSNQTILFNTVPQKFDVSTVPTGGIGSFTYQWQSSTDNAIWTNINGANDAFYQSPSIAQTTYFKRLTTSGTCGTIATNTITVTVTTEVLVGTIGNDQTICYSTAPNLLTTLTQPSQGVVINSQIWQKSEDGTVWADITAATTDTYQPGTLTVKTYYRKKMVTANSGTIYTNIVSITVNPAFNPGTIGGEQSICKTYASIPLTTTVAPNGQSVQTLWQISDNNTSFTDIAGAVNDSYDAGILTSSKYFRKKVANSCASGFTNSVKITVNEELQSGNIGSDQAIAYNTSPLQLIGAVPTGGSGAFIYQWYYSTNSIDWQIIISNGDGKDYQPFALTQKTYFKRKVTSGSCGEKYSNVVTINVFDSLLPGTVSEAQSICYNTAPALLTGSNPSGGSGQYSYQWQSSLQGTVWTDIIGEVGISYRPENLTSNTYFRRAVTSANSQVFSNFVMIRVFDNVEKPVTDLKTSYCKGANINLNIVNPAYITYKWYDNQHNYIIDGTRYSINGISANSTVYVKSVSANSCLSDFLEQNITVDNVKAHFTSDITTVTLGNAVRFTSTSTNASTYSWNFFEGDIIHDANPIHYYNTLNGADTKKFDVKLSVVSPNGCLDSLLLFENITVVKIVTGINENESVTLSFYPNPVMDKLYISSTESIKTIKVFSLIGSLIKTLTFDQESVSIDFSDIKPGVYILEVNGMQETKKNFKIIKR